MSLQVVMALKTVLLPMGAVAAMTLLGGRARWRRAPLGALLGIVGAHLAIAGVPSMPPVDTVGWVPLCTISAALVFVLVGRPVDRVPLALIAASSALTLGVMLLLVLGPLYQSWTLAEAITWTGLAVAVGVVIWITVDSTLPHHPSATLASLIIATVAMAVALAMSGTAMVGQLLGATAAATGALLLQSWFGKLEPSHALATVLATALVGQAGYGCFYVDIPAAAALLCSLASLGAVAARIGRSPAQSFAAASALTLLLSGAGFAVMLSYQETTLTQDPWDSE